MTTSLDAVRISLYMPSKDDVPPVIGSHRRVWIKIGLLPYLVQDVC